MLVYLRHIFIDILVNVDVKAVVRLAGQQEGVVDVLSMR